MYVQELDDKTIIRTKKYFNEILPEHKNSLLRDQLVSFFQRIFNKLGLFKSIEVQKWHVD